MNKLKTIIFTIIFLAFVSCKEDNKTLQAKLTITDFKEVPNEIDGCSCFFSETEKKYNSNEYLIATNLDSIAFVSLNNKIIKLKLVEKKIEPNSIDNENYTAIFANKKYKATIEVKEDRTKKNADEVWWNIGTIKVEDKNGNQQTKKFIGECGC